MFALVTGATGCLGRHIVRQLLNGGHRVRALCRNPTSGCLPVDGTDETESRGNVEIVPGDVRDPAGVDKAVRGVDTVLHSAGVAGMWGPWKSFHATNVIGTQHVLEACRRHGVRRDERRSKGADGPPAAKWLDAVVIGCRDSELVALDD